MYGYDLQLKMQCQGARPIQQYSQPHSHRVQSNASQPCKYAICKYGKLFAKGNELAPLTGLSLLKDGNELVIHLCIARSCFFFQSCWSAGTGLPRIS